MYTVSVGRWPIFLALKGPVSESACNGSVLYVLIRARTKRITAKFLLFMSAQVLVSAQYMSKITLHGYCLVGPLYEAEVKILVLSHLVSARTQKAPIQI